MIDGGIQNMNHLNKLKYEGARKSSGGKSPTLPRKIWFKVWPSSKLPRRHGLYLGQSPACCRIPVFPAKTGRVDQTGQANRVFEVRGSPNRGADIVTELRVDFGDVRRPGNREDRRRSSL